MRNFIIYFSTLILIALVSYAAWINEITNGVSILVSAFLGVLSIAGSSYFNDKTAFIESTKGIHQLIHGAVSIGLSSIKSLNKTKHRHSEMANKTTNSYSFIGIAGRKVLDDLFESKFFKQNDDEKNIRIILMDPFSIKMSNFIDNSEMKSKIISDIISSIQYLKDKTIEGRKFELRLFPRIPPARIIISDKRLISISSYSKDSDGWKNPEMFFEVNNAESGSVIDFCELFESLWERASGVGIHHRANALMAIPSENSKKNKKTSIQQYEKSMVHGRFQPFHNEHLEFVLLGLLHSKTKLFIGITNPENNSQKNEMKKGADHRYNPESNPYTFEQRKEMIEKTLSGFNIPKNRYEIIPFDIDLGQEAIKKLSKDKGEDIVHILKIFSEWEREKIQLIQDSGMKYHILNNHEMDVSQKHISGTLVRELFSSKRNWEDYTPSGTNSVLKQIELEKTQRVKK